MSYNFQAAAEKVMANFMIVQHPKRVRSSRGRLSSTIKLSVCWAWGYKTNEASSYNHSQDAVHSAAGTQQASIPNKSRLTRLNLEAKEKLRTIWCVDVVLKKLASL